MIVNEKALVKAIKSSNKNSGYRLVCYEHDGENWIAIMGAGYLVEMLVDTIPRKVLGILVEHAGKIPELNVAWKVCRWNVQTELFKYALDKVQVLDESVLSTGKFNTIKPTKLMWGELQVWQKPDDLTLLLMNRELVEIINSKINTKTDGSCILEEDFESRVFIWRMQTSDDEGTGINHLAKIQLV